MQLISNYNLAPGQCRLCNTARIPAVDTGLDYDGQGYDGRLYICATCIAALYSMTAGTAGAPGLVPAYRYNEMSERNALLEQQVADLHTALEAGRGEGGLAETLRTLAGALDQAQPSRSPSEQVGTGGTASVSTGPTNELASLPPHPLPEQVDEAEGRARQFGQAPPEANAEPDPELVRAHQEADRAQRGDQRTDPAGEFGTAQVASNTPVPDDEEQAKLRSDPDARFAAQQERADDAEVKAAAARAKASDDEWARRSDQTGPTAVQAPRDAQAREDAAREGGDRFAQTHPGAEAAQASADWNERERIIAGQDVRSAVEPGQVDNARTKAAATPAGKLSEPKDETIDVGKPGDKAPDDKADDKPKVGDTLHKGDDHDPKGKPLGKDKDKAKK